MTIYLFFSLAILGPVVLYFLRSAYQNHVYRRVMRQYGCQPIPRYPHKDPLGYDLSKIMADGVIKGDTTAMRKKLFFENGNTFAFNWIGKKAVLTCDKDNVQTVLGTSVGHFIQVPLRNKIAKPLLGTGLLTQDGGAWARARSLAMSVLGKDQAADLSSLEGHFQKMLRLIPRDGSTIDLQPLLKRLFIDKGTEFILGESVNSLAPEEADPDVESYLDMFEKALRVMGLRLRAGNLRFLRGRDLEWHKNCQAIHASLDKFIDKAIERKKRPEAGTRHKFVLIDKYLDMTDDRREIQMQVMSVFLGARDQIGIAMSLLMFGLARHPDVWAKVRSEALASRGPLTLANLKSRTFARHTVLESFRMYPAVMGAVRYCQTDCILPHGGGPDGLEPVLIQRGTQVEMDIRFLHFDKSVWGEDADKFVPERWSDGKSRSWDWMPFLQGRRACPAMNMALNQMTYVLVRLAQEFRSIENRDPAWDLVDDMRNVRQSRNGVKVALIPA